jgi:uncharacterized protein RhaS with RHS repeats
LQLLGHRYYDPSIGRFLSSDPAKVGTNWYAYSNNNPLNRIDALGLTWRQVGAILGGVIGGLLGAPEGGVGALPGSMIGSSIGSFFGGLADGESPEQIGNGMLEDGFTVGILGVVDIAVRQIPVGGGGGGGTTIGEVLPRPSGPPHSWHYTTDPPGYFTGGLNSESWTTPQKPTGSYYNPIYAGEKLGIPTPKYAYPIYPAAGDAPIGPTPIQPSNHYPWAGSTGELEYNWPNGTSPGTVGRPIHLN